MFPLAQTVMKVMQTLQIPEKSQAKLDREGLTDKARWMKAENDCPKHADMDSDEDALFLRMK